MKEKTQNLQFEFNKEKLVIHCVWAKEAKEKKYSFYAADGEEVEDFSCGKYTVEFCEAWQKNVDLIFEKMDKLIEGTAKKIVFQGFSLTKIKSQEIQKLEEN